MNGNSENLIKLAGVVAGVVMPLWNIPLMIRIVQRKSSSDISLAWLFGVWGCILLMFPSCLQSPDMMIKAFGISNIVFFTMVVIVVMIFRKKKSRPTNL